MVFKATFNWFTEIVTSNGTVIRCIEQVGGSAIFSVVAENVNPDDFMANEGGEGEWLQVDEDEAIRWTEACHE